MPAICGKKFCMNANAAMGFVGSKAGKPGGGVGGGGTLMNGYEGTMRSGGCRCGNTPRPDVRGSLWAFL